MNNVLKYSPSLSPFIENENKILKSSQNNSVYLLKLLLHLTLDDIHW